jgi:hypothetical protein
MSRYQEIRDELNQQITMIYDKEENFYFPLSNDNRRYREYLTWLSQGNTPDSPEVEE